MKKQIEEKLGFQVSMKQFLLAKKRAEKKRDVLIERFGSADGKRSEEEYLFELIYEELLSELLKKKTMLYMEKEHLAKNKVLS